jgi:tetratricopeptide (TPR) repeat protein
MRRLPNLFCAAALLLPVVAAAADLPAVLSRDTIAALSTSLAEAERRLGPVDPQLLAILDPLAQLQYRAAKIDRATELRRRALKIAVGAFGNESVPAARAMIALARLYIERQRYLDAEPLLIAAGNTLRGERHTESETLADILTGRAAIDLAEGRHKCARKLAEEAVAIGAHDNSVTHRRAMRLLGTVLANDGEFATSENTLRRVLALDRSANDGLGSARSLAALGNAYLRQKRFAEALPLLEQAAEIDQSRLGPTHPVIADDLYGVGLADLGLGRSAEGRTVLRAAVDLLNRGAGRGTPALAYVELALARADRQAGHNKEAQSRFADAQRILNAAADEDRERERDI